jgi:hypothetical protein
VDEARLGEGREWEDGGTSHDHEAHGLGDDGGISGGDLIGDGLIEPSVMIKLHHLDKGDL